MELVMSVFVGIVMGLVGLALFPVLVVGTWWVIMTVIFGLSDGIIWVLDRRWRTTDSEGGSKTGLNSSSYKILMNTPRQGTIRK